MLLPQSEIPILPDALKWETVPLGPDESLEGWIAGPVQVVQTHWDKFRNCSRPCRAFMSKGAVRCPCEDEPIRMRVIGYVPVIDKYKKKFVVILSALVAHEAGKLKQGEAVKFLRPKIANRPVRIVRLGEGAIASSVGQLVRDRKPADIGEYLLHLWQDRELTEHFQVKYHPSAANAEKQQDTTEAA